MLQLLGRYTRWLHTRWPAGTVERLPRVAPDGSTNVPGIYVVGDLAGIPLLKFSADTGARVIQTIVSDAAFQRLRQADRDPAIVDVVILGAGVSGMAAALEARAAGLSFQLIEASEPFSTLVNFPRGKPIYTYPTEMRPAGSLEFRADIKEALVDELRAQTVDRGIAVRMARAERVTRSGQFLEVQLAGESAIRARRVVVAIGRSGNYRKLGVPGEEMNKVYNRLHDPREFAGKAVLVVGGGDSALETAIALAESGAQVALSYRKPEFARPKPANIERLTALAWTEPADGQDAPPGRIRLMLGSQVVRIDGGEVAVVDAGKREWRLPNDAVFTMIGREAPLDFFRRSGVQIHGEWTLASMASLAAFVLFCFWLYHWKGYVEVPFVGPLPAWLTPEPAKFWSWVKEQGGAIGSAAADPRTLIGTVAAASSNRWFWYTLAYSLVVVIFGIRRMQRRRTPYVRRQTLTLMAVQVLPLFIIPELLLPYMDANGAFDTGLGASFKQAFFPDEQWWRAYGFVLAWPLFIANVFTPQPMTAWLVVSLIQTAVLIPLLIYFYGKGAYCGWICSCGALAETLGDQHRHKMPHGPGWSRLNMLGQAILAAALLLLLLRVAGWAGGEHSWAARSFAYAEKELPLLNYKYFVDLLLAGVVGYGLYFWFSGRVWCRFACPLAALMHVYARFSRFRILADKKKCISCNVCTSVCHQGIDVMNFANKGLPMADPECVRCSACVQMCPTGVLEFGQINPRTGQEIARDRVPASLVRLTENGKPRFEKPLEVVRERETVGR